MVAGGASAYGEEYYDGTLKCAQLVVAPRMPNKTVLLVCAMLTSCFLRAPDNLQVCESDPRPICRRCSCTTG
eukprot:scaffold278737_cov63-Attheya_sp.AAC.1